MLEYIEIDGKQSLQGTIKASGAKNAALPVLFSTLMSPEVCTLSNVPNLEDVNIAATLLRSLGAEIERSGDKISIQVKELTATEASYSLVKSLRASFWVLGPLLARGGAARVSLPGGDIIGARPVDMHLAALTKMGAEIKVKHGIVYASAPAGLRPCKHEFRFPSVGATHQVMMAAALTPGTTVVENAAREPEVVALAEFINRMGGSIEEAGQSTIVINGKRDLGGASYELIGDRVEAGTYVLAALASGGRVKIEGIEPAFLTSFLDILKEAGAEVNSGDSYIEVASRSRMSAVNVSTAPFPGLATDLQAPLMAALATASGESSIEENIFEGRFGHVSELCRLGARIEVKDRLARITGVDELAAAPVEALDIRAGAALVVAALGAEGVTQIHEIQHLRRGYENLEHKLSNLGASIRCKITDAEDFVFTGC